MSTEEHGTKQETDALQGHGLLQSQEEGGARNRTLTGTLVELINRYQHFEIGRALDMGCEEGTLTNGYVCPARAITGSPHWAGL